MGTRAEFWRKHVVALNLAGVTSKAYGEQHGLSVHSLRHRVGGFKSDPTMAAAPDSGGFVALRLAEEETRVVADEPAAQPAGG